MWTGRPSAVQIFLNLRVAHLRVCFSFALTRGLLGGTHLTTLNLTQFEMNRCIKILLSCIGIWLLLGCATPEQRASRAWEEEQRRQAVARQFRDLIDNECRGYGFQPNTNEFANCLMKLDQQVRSNIAAQQARRNLESRCEWSRVQGLLAPTRTGRFEESLSAGTAAYANCMAGLPPAPSPTNIICRRQGRDEVYCFNQ